MSVTTVGIHPNILDANSAFPGTTVIRTDIPPLILVSYKVLTPANSQSGYPNTQRKIHRHPRASEKRRPLPPRRGTSTGNQRNPLGELSPDVYPSLLPYIARGANSLSIVIYRAQISEPMPRKPRDASPPRNDVAHENRYAIEVAPTGLCTPD